MSYQVQFGGGGGNEDHQSVWWRVLWTLRWRGEKAPVDLQKFENLLCVKRFESGS